MEKTIVVSKEISATPQDVWNLITDLPSMGGGHQRMMAVNGFQKTVNPKSVQDSSAITVWAGNKWKAPVRITELNEPQRLL